MKTIFYNTARTTQHDILALRKYFNKIFDKMKKTKEYEINLVRERNQRLRHIQFEKNVLEKLKNSTVEHYREIVDPEYMHDENPNSIIKASQIWLFSVLH